MQYKYSITKLLASLAGYRGLPFPGGFVSPVKRGSGKGPYEIIGENTGRKEFGENGTRIYKPDLMGRWYFMPVCLRHRLIKGTGINARKTGGTEKDPDGKYTFEIPYAVISISGEKKIVETELAGRSGSVKELISISDYKISVTGFIRSDDGSYPENEIARMRDIFRINESVELISALSDLLLEQDNMVVIKSISYPPTPGIEDGQAVKIECISDAPFELVIK